MVNLSDTSTVEDLTSPEGIARFDEFYRSLTAHPRLAGTVKVFHVWIGGRSFVSCDFPLAALNLDTLVTGCSDALLNLKPDDVVPPQPRDRWWEFWRVPNLKFYMHWNAPTHRRASVMVVVRGERWP